jgi:hypothetical protein
MTLRALLLAVATLYPVGPRLSCEYEEFSEVDGLLEFAAVMSKSSVIPAGAIIEPFALFPNRPTTSAPFTVVVSDGAAMRRVLALKTPSCASTGAITSTPA